MVIVYAVGSFEPLSSSSNDAVLYFKFKFFERKIFDTLAKSVEPTIEPMSIPSNNSKPRMR